MYFSIHLVCQYLVNIDALKQCLKLPSKCPPQKKNEENPRASGGLPPEPPPGAGPGAGPNAGPWTPLVYARAHCALDLMFCASSLNFMTNWLSNEIEGTLVSTLPIKMSWVRGWANIIVRVQRSLTLKHC